jgi:transposase
MPHRPSSIQPSIHGPLVAPGASQPECFGFVGLDIGQDELVACVIGPDGRTLAAPWTISNDQPGAQALAQRLLDLSQARGLRGLRIGLEATSLYWWHLTSYLKDTPILAPLQPEVYLINPSVVKAYKKLYPDRGKSDRLDALYIADCLRNERLLPTPFELDLLYAPLQRLTRFRVHLAEALAREKNYFLTFLFLKFSGFSQGQPFSDPFGATSSALLEELTTEELVETPVEKLAEYLDTKGRGRFEDPQQLAASLQRLARDSYRLDKALDEPVSLVLATTLANIRTFQRQLDVLDKSIARELEALPLERRIIRSVPGLGPVFTAGLVAEIGNIHRFDNEAGLARMAGLVWNQHQSGSFQGEDTSLAKSGNAYLRYYLIEAANSVRLNCAEYQGYYAAKFAQSTKHAHKRALVLTARKLVRLIDCLLRAGVAYQDPEARQDQREVSTEPRAARPGPPRRVRLAQAAG